MNSWLTKFLPGVVLGVVLQWLVGRDAKDGVAGGPAGAAHESRSSRGRRQGQRTGRPSEELKMVLVVNDELKMGKGKIGAQCAHAAVGLVERLGSRHSAVLRQWEACGQPKICLRAESSQQLRALASAASVAGLPTYIVQDAGRTQVAPGSRTVLAIGPAARSQVDSITGGLKLL